MPLLMTTLPIDAAIPDVLAALKSSRSLVLVAPPGAGKTTRVPPAVLRANLLNPEHPNLVMLQPRRVAARASATRIAEEQRWTLGREVGYHVRFERKLTIDTRLRVLTEGILTRQLLSDPILEGVGCVILDEFHERNLNTDLAIAMLREVQQTVREDLILIVMSATLEAAPVAKFLGDCPIVRSLGRMFPIEMTYLQPAPGYLDEQVADAVRRVLIGDLREMTGSVRDTIPRDLGDDASDVRDGADGGDAVGGDVLVFLPGADEIRRTAQTLESLARDENLLIVPLHGSLPFEEQARALKPAGRRKVILSTNIAETSLTIEGVRTVIDSGRARVAGFDAQRGLDQLELQWISKASSSQRAGRAGRTAPGRCIRLWSEKHQHTLEDFDVPEIKRVDLCATVLSLHAWGATDPRKFGWYDAPPEESLASAERLLTMLGALSGEPAGKITPLGKRIMQVPAHPRLARLLIGAADRGIAREGATIAALLSEKDILLPDRSAPPSQRGPATIAASDLLVRLQAFDDAERDGFRFGGSIDMNAARQVAQARDHFLNLASYLTDARSRAGDNAFVSPPRLRGAARGEDGSANTPRKRGGETKALQFDSILQATEIELLQLPILAYPDRVARRRESNPSAAVMVGGVGLKLAAESVVRHGEFFLALDARRDERSPTREALVRVASAIDVTWLEQLFPQSIARERTAVFDETRGAVVGRATTRYLDLPLRESDDVAVDAETAERVLAEHLTPERLRAMSLADEHARRWIDRVELLKKVMPSQPWPSLWSDDFAREVAQSAVRGKRSFAGVGKAIPDALRVMLHYPLDRLLETDAPETIEVPTGNKIRLDYASQNDQPSDIAPPVLAVRLQEMFGLAETPRIAGGRVPVVLHLLGPNYRPVQITQNLRSFWANTYAQVRKDLKARYPKHSWPDNPLTAPPQARGARRRTS